jgi:hypothetical protein
VLLPEKHLKLSESLLGFGAFVLKHLNKPRDFDFLWKKYKQDFSGNKVISIHSNKNLILAMDFLFALGIVSLDEEGRIKSEVDQTLSKQKQVQDGLF